MNTKLRSLLPYALLLAIFAVLAVYGLLSDGTYQDDDVLHYQIAR